MEMSCLSGVDEDGIERNSKMSAFTLLQEPVTMAQQSTSCADSFNMPNLKLNSGLDVLSNTHILSSGTLENGPSLHPVTKNHDCKSESLEKDEEKSITTLKTVQEIDTAGIWSFDGESPNTTYENENFGSASDLSWDPHREFMQFLWENHDDSPAKEPQQGVSASIRKRRKRKMDMVIMVDPSENLDPNLSSNSCDESSDAEDEVVQKSQKLFSLSSSPEVTKYPNGSGAAIKEVFSRAPARKPQANSLNDRLVKGNSTYPCSKCKLVFKRQHHLLHHLKSHKDHPGILPYSCTICRQSFKQSAALVDHMSVHQDKSVENIKDSAKVQIKKLYCPQCSFVTTYPNAFVQHAKTHEKEKRSFACDKCSYKATNAEDLKTHEKVQHSVVGVKVKKQPKKHQYESFPCSLCSYKAFSEEIFHKHLVLRHQMSLEDYMEAHGTEEFTKPAQVPKLTTRTLLDEHKKFKSNSQIQNPVPPKAASLHDESTSISDLFSSKVQRGPKSQRTESKLDRSINVLLSRQSQEQKNQEQKESNNCNTSAQDSTSDKFDADGTADTVPGSVQDSVATANCLKLNLDHLSYKKSQSKRKMSIPYRNTSDQDACFILPKHLTSNNKVNLVDEVADNGEREALQVKETLGSCNFLDKNNGKEKRSIIYTYSRRMSMRGALQASKRLFEKIKTEEEEQIISDIKEECIETEVFQETFDSHQIPFGESFQEDLPELESGQKNCPYCPALFESGVGLSNHIRGHLHRVGLSYNARHVVSPEQVTSQDRRPRIRRKLAAIRRLRRAMQLDSDSEAPQGGHSCPLCGDSFDNRTGQSNHIRGHLKKLGRTFSAKSKSPLVLLRELMRDKKECQRALQILGKRRNHFHYGASPKLHTANCFLPPLAGFTKSSSLTRECSDAISAPAFPTDQSEPEHTALDGELEVKNSLSGTTDLIGILKRRKCQEEARLKASTQASRPMVKAPTNSELSAGSRVASLPNSGSEKGEFNRKVCIHCNATFHSGVSLSNHLRAYAKRKSIALLEGTTIDCKAVRTRSRPGSKKKSEPPSQSQSPEEVYRLTCRFCDLVFQGPLSVQEDWIKHLQRHLMNTGVPHSGLGLVEVGPLAHSDGC